MEDSTIDLIVISGAAKSDLDLVAEVLQTGQTCKDCLVQRCRKVSLSWCKELPMGTEPGAHMRSPHTNAC